MKICKDCKHYREMVGELYVNYAHYPNPRGRMKPNDFIQMTGTSISPYKVCDIRTEEFIDNVTGDSKTVFKECSIEREFGCCGEDGKFFEEKVYPDINLNQTTYKCWFSDYQQYEIGGGFCWEGEIVSKTICLKKGDDTYKLPCNNKKASMCQFFTPWSFKRVIERYIIFNDLFWAVIITLIILTLIVVLN